MIVNQQFSVNRRRIADLIAQLEKKIIDKP